MLEAIIFDVDGTLSETEEVHRRAFNEAFLAFGLEWRWDRPLYRELLKVTGGKERLTHYLRSYRPDFVADGGLASFVRDVHGYKTERYTGLIGEGAAELRPGIERLIGEARAAGIRLAIATTTTMANLAALLGSTLGPEALWMFEAVCAGDSVLSKKPAPDAYLDVLKHLDLPAVRCVAIEDSENGLWAARAAGVPVVVTRSGYTWNEAFEGAAVVVDNLDSGGQLGELPFQRIDLAILQRIVADGEPPSEAAVRR